MITLDVRSAPSSQPLAIGCSALFFALLWTETGWCPVVSFDVCCSLLVPWMCRASRPPGCQHVWAGSSQTKVLDETIAKRFSACYTPLTRHCVLPTGSSGRQAAEGMFDLQVSDGERLML